MNNYKIGFIFDTDHVWSMEELTELQNILNESTWNWHNFNKGDMVYIDSHSNIINHDFIVRRIDHTEKRIVLYEM